MFARSSAGITRRRLRGWNKGAIGVVLGGQPPPVVISTTATSSAWGAVRNLNLYEFPAMELMREHGIRTPRSYLASDPEEVRDLFRRNFSKENDTEQGFRTAFLKAQVLMGGSNPGVFDNGFEGSVHLVSDPEEAFGVAEQMLGHKLVTKQAPKGVLCHQLVLVENLSLRRELYVSILMDRHIQGPILIGSASGGAFLDKGRSISDSSVLPRSNSVFTEHIDIADGLEVDQCERMAENLGLDQGTKAFDRAVETMTNLYSMFVERDCTMIEVHPLGETHSGDIVAVKSIVQCDDNASFRQGHIFADQKNDSWDEMDPREAMARKEGIDYIGLDGSIGCMVNGAGLAMATMDLIHSKHGRPSNFLDVGGDASERQVKTALSILEADPRVKVILVNIFGGLMRCDVIANGILGVSREIGIQTPMVLRLQGTNYEAAKALITEECGHYGNVRLVDDLDEAATLAVHMAKTVDGVVANDKVEGIHHLDGSGEIADDPLDIAALVSDSTVVIATEVAEELAAASHPRVEREIPRFKGFSL